VLIDVINKFGSLLFVRVYSIFMADYPISSVIFVHAPWFFLRPGAI